MTIDGKTSGHCCQLEILERDLLTADVPVPLVGVVDASLGLAVQHPDKEDPFIGQLDGATTFCPGEKSPNENSPN